MKRISFLLAALTLCAAPVVHAQDAATQERLDKLAGRLDDQEKRQEALGKQLSDLSRELQNLREQLDKPNNSYARQEDLKSLADAIKEVDRKRIEDAEKVRTELLKLRNALEKPLPSTRQKPSPPTREKPTPEKPAGDEKVFSYTIQSGDTLDAIVLAYKEKGVKVTVAQILAANPGLKADRLRVGQKIYIPAPQN
jgi:nucleoid-associated protein YgaU